MGRWTYWNVIRPLHWSWAGWVEDFRRARTYLREHWRNVFDQAGRQLQGERNVVYTCTTCWSRSGDPHGPECHRRGMVRGG